MRLRHVRGAREHIEEDPFCECEPEGRRGRWADFFDEVRPVHLEIGCGKGRFLAQMAQLHPQINYLGIEKYSSVLYRALQKQDALELGNLRFVRMEAEILPMVFAPGEVERIYLNFSDPWPKERHAQRRLPSASFLARYEEVLVPGGSVFFKTDNESLFDFALEELDRAGWTPDAVSRDLHADPVLVRDNCMTEYEERFVSMGKPIFCLRMHKNKHT